MCRRNRVKSQQPKCQRGERTWQRQTVGYIRQRDDRHQEDQPSARHQRRQIWPQQVSRDGWNSQSSLVSFIKHEIIWQRPVSSCLSHNGLICRFRLHFEKENKEDVERRKKTAMEKILKPVVEKELEMDINQIYPEEKGIHASESFKVLVVKVVMMIRFNFWIVC